MTALRIGVTAAEAIAGRLEDLTPAMTQVGAILTSKAQKAFREQGRPGHPWPERMTPNVPAIVEDLNRGTTPPSRRFTGRPAGIDTGRLRNSLTFAAAPRSVEVGTTVEYASDVQGGGETLHVLTGQGRRNLYELLRSRRDLRGELGWLFSRPRFVVNVRPRPFLVLTDEDRDEVQQLVDDFVRGA